MKHNKPHLIDLASSQKNKRKTMCEERNEERRRRRYEIYNQFIAIIIKA
jgi:hypothetical protein